MKNASPRRWLVLLLVLPLGAACANTPSATSQHPDARLDAILEAWRDHRAAGGGCDDSFEPDRPVVDCRRIMKALEVLALEFPRHPEVLLSVAVLAQEDSQPEKAQSYLAALLEVQPDHAEAAMLRARIAMGQGNLPLAARTLEEQILYAPDHAGLRETFASVAYLQGDWVAAERRLRAAEQLGAPDWRIAYHRGLIAEAQGFTEEAGAHYRRALDARPDFERARARLAGIMAGLSPN